VGEQTYCRKQHFDEMPKATLGNSVKFFPKKYSLVQNAEIFFSLFQAFNLQIVYDKIVQGL